ncbi:MAG: ABC transporter ATP-binding protein [Muribaculaceae bacterium]|nr:ABC transporter ATP-binding protein [Muribaculaceae bacterium]
MIELTNLTFSYLRNGYPALNDISCVIEPGIRLLAGENGAGKTTLLHNIAGLSRPTGGHVTIDGSDPASDKPEDLGRVFLLEENQFFPGKSIREFAAMHSRFYRRFSNELFYENLHAFGLTGDESLSNLSLGNRKKSELAYVLALGVDVLLLDEPTNGLDIEGREALRHIIGGATGDGQTIIISTHAVGELEHLYDGAIFLSKGHLLYAGNLDDVDERLAFTVTKVPEPEAIYSELQVGRVLNICDAAISEGGGTVNWRLLYSGLHSPLRQELLNILNSPSII